MKNTLLLTLITCLIISCQKSKEYRYVESGLKENLFGRTVLHVADTIVIKAETDSIAYMEAYKKYCISEKINKDMKESLGTSSTTPTNFKLINENGEDIASTLSFLKMDSLKGDIRSVIFEMKNSIQGSIDRNNQKELVEIKELKKIDSAKVNELVPFFDIKKDEFDKNGLTWYKPKSAPKYANRNAVYCYFQSINGVPSNLRMRLQYHSDDWLFFHKVQFSIDGKAFEITPINTETDSGNGGRIWEWFDESMGGTHDEFLSALSNAKSAKMKLIGTQYHDIKPISSNEITNIKRTLELYKAMGGEL